MPEPPVVTPEPQGGETLCRGLDFLRARQCFGAEHHRSSGGLRRAVRLEGARVLRSAPARVVAARGKLVLAECCDAGGRETLEQASTLILNGTALRSLRPLSGLRSVQSLQIDDTDLVDLAGLENVSGPWSILIQYNRELETLTGLVPGDRVDDLSLNYNAALRDVTPLGNLREVVFLPCPALEYVELLSIRSNPSLVEVSARGRATASATRTGSAPGGRIHSVRRTDRLLNPARRPRRHPAIARRRSNRDGWRTPQRGCTDSRDRCG